MILSVFWVGYLSWILWSRVFSQSSSASVLFILEQTLLCVLRIQRNARLFNVKLIFNKVECRITFFPKFSKLSPKRDISESEFKTRAKNQSVHPYWQVFKAWIGPISGKNHPSLVIGLDQFSRYWAESCPENWNFEIILDEFSMISNWFANKAQGLTVVPYFGWIEKNLRGWRNKVFTLVIPEYTRIYTISEI